ncbi:MAG: hypothetical protein R3C31_08450 [Hyphomonadaceae bacterium]
MLLRIAALAALVFLATPVPPACACSCAGPAISGLTFAIRGEVTDVEITELRPHVEVGVATVTVSEVLRGPADMETVRVAFLVGDGVNCGVRISRGYRGFLTGTGQPGHYSTGLCTQVNEAAFRQLAGAH